MRGTVVKKLRKRAEAMTGGKTLKVTKKLLRRMKKNYLAKREGFRIRQSRAVRPTDPATVS